MPVSGINRRPLTQALIEKARTSLFHNLGRAYRTFNFDTVAEEILRPLMRETEAEYGALSEPRPGVGSNGSQP